MARIGRGVSPRQKAAGKHNLMKAQVGRIGKRGMVYRKKGPKGW